MGRSEPSFCSTNEEQKSEKLETPSKTKKIKKDTNKSRPTKSSTSKKSQRSPAPTAPTAPREENKKAADCNNFGKLLIGSVVDTMLEVGETLSINNIMMIHWNESVQEILI